MGYEIRFDDGTPESKDWVFVLGSATDLEAIRRWVKDYLPTDECPRLHELADTLTTTNTMELGAELEAAREIKPPPAWLLPIIDNLIDRIGTGDEDETAVIADGFDEDGGEDDSGDQDRE